MISVRDTALFKAISPQIRKRDQREFARMLSLAIMAVEEEKRRGNMYGYTGASDLQSAFCWALTPQGNEYWMELDRRLSE